MLLMGGLTDTAVAQTGAAPPRRTAAAAGAPAAATITYISGTTAYLEIGTRHGVIEGTTFTVVRGGVHIGELQATFVSSSRTACTISPGAGALAVGDSVRYVAVAVAAPVVENATAANRSTPVRRAPRRSPVRGRVGVRYLTVGQPGGGTLRQPSLDLRLDGNQVSGSSMGLAVDVRMQRSSVSGGDGVGAAPAGATRVYQAAVIRQATLQGSRLAVGRQFATALSPIGIFDGVALDLNGDRWSGGALAGTMPDARTFSPSATTTEAGLWIQRHNVPGSQTPWSATVGVIGSYNRGEIDREFLYLRGTWNSRSLSLHFAEEIDANRGWKRKVEGAFATPTSTLLTAQLRLNSALSVSGGLDSRRSVRLYRDFVNPEIAFDDALRQGQWGEVAVRPSRHVRLSTDIRHNGGGSEGGAQSITTALSIAQVTAIGLGVRARTTQYRSPQREGRLSSAAIEASPTQAIRFSLNGGLRTSGIPGSSIAPNRLTWAGGDLDVAVGRSLYLMLSTYRESGPTASVQTYAAVTWRF